MSARKVISNAAGMGRHAQVAGHRPFVPPDGSGAPPLAGDQQDGRVQSVFRRRKKKRGQTPRRQGGSPKPVCAEPDQEMQGIGFSVPQSNISPSSLAPPPPVVQERFIAQRHGY